MLPLILHYLLAAAPPTGVLLVGDSLMKVGVAPVLKKALAAHFEAPVENRAKSSTGLARPDFYDWPKVAAELLKDGKYGSVVLFIGANDCQAVKDAGGKERRFDTPEWREEYGARIKAMATLLCEGGRKAYWLGLPPMEKASFDKRIRRLDEFIDRTLAASGSCVRYIPMKDALSASGKFASRLMVDRQRVRVREPDGIHITQYGGKLVAETLLKEMERNAAPAAGSPPAASSPPLR